MADQANIKLITKAAVVYLRKYVCSIKDKPFRYFQENLQELLFEIHHDKIQQLNMVFHAFSQKNWLDRGINAFPGFYLFLLQHLQVKNSSNTEYLQSIGFLATERSNANFLQSQMIKQDPATTSLTDAIKQTLGKILQLEP